MDSLKSKVIEDIIGEYLASLSKSMGRQPDSDFFVDTKTVKNREKIVTKSKESSQKPPPLPKDAAITQKIERVAKAGKYLNVETGRAISKNKVNEEKYVFYDQLKIAGTRNSVNLKRALSQLGLSSVEPSPKSNTVLETDGLSDSD